MSFYLEKDEILALVNGDFQWRTCTECSGKGWYWVDGVTGVVVDGPSPDREISEYYQHGCERCKSLGGKIIFKEERL